MEKESTEFTSFTTPLGKFMYASMPFSLRNTPAHFQNLMYIVLSKHIGKNIQVYKDDIIIATETIDQHFEI
ncbi:POL3 [Hepatospora eriocheir]|uniref:POL3 n=1 Tax=Hepatospora eriocheir TaxID=1081669 RepID=A0A1X0Q7S3_9MICR|nr:POL3 [Hepatospora eriocheir]